MPCAKRGSGCLESEADDAICIVDFNFNRARMQLLAKMASSSREVLTCLQDFNYCTVKTSDNMTFRLSKCSLAEHSKVLRSMISEFKTETELRISDNGESLTLLLDVIYSRYPIDGSSRQSQRRMLNASSNLHASMMSDRQRMHVINI